MSEFKAWYCEPIGKVRVTSTPGGVALDLDGARSLRDELDDAIQELEEHS